MAVSSAERHVPVLPSREEGTEFPHLDKTYSWDDWISYFWGEHLHKTPVWRERAEERGLDRMSVTGLEDVKDVLEPAEEDDFDPSLGDRWKEYRREDIPVSDYENGRSSGKTGPQKVIPRHENVGDRVVEWNVYNLDAHGFEGMEGKNVQIIGPPGIYEQDMTRTVQQLGGDYFFHGVPTRGLKGYMEAAREGDEEAHRKLQNIFEPVYRSVREEVEGNEIQGIFSAPAMADTIHEMMEEPSTEANVEDVELILLSGTAISEEEVDGIDSAFPNARTIPLYTSSWFGTAWPPADYPEREDRTPEYHLNPEYPFQVVDPETGEEVGYGERGQIEITIANEGAFIPRVQEDYVTRIRPQEQFDHDGLRAVGRS